MSETIWSQADPTGVPGYALTSPSDETYGLYFTVNAACALTAIWFYSPSGSTSLPTWTALSTTTTGATGTLVAQDSSPSWSGAAGSGWVRDNSFPATLLSTGVSYVAQYSGALIVSQAYLYTGATPAAWFPSSSPSGLITAPQYLPATTNCNGPYAFALDTFPTSTLGGNLNFLMDVECAVASAFTAPPFTAFMSSM